MDRYSRRQGLGSCTAPLAIERHRVQIGSFGTEPNWRHWSLPSSALERRLMTLLAWRCSIQRLSVRLAPLHETSADGRAPRHARPGATIRNLTVLTSRVRLASVACLLALVPKVAVLGLNVVDGNTAQQKKALRAAAEQLPQAARAESAVRQPPSRSTETCCWRCHNATG
jgi:cytochrome c553